MKFHKIAVLMACIISTPALAWSNGGDFNGSVEFGGTVSPEKNPQLWQWKVGTGLGQFYNDAEHMSENFTKLTINVTEAQPILLGNTKSALVAYDGAVGITPKISFTDFENNEITLNQDQSSSEGVGYLELPVKIRNDNEKIGTVKINAKAVALGVVSLKDYSSTPYLFSAMSLKASSDDHLFYGALFNRSIADGYGKGNALTSAFGNASLNDLKNVLSAHPLITYGPWLQAADNYIRLSHDGAGVSAHEGVVTASYSLGIDAGQTLELEFDKPIASTTEWSAPLNIAVTYN
ncbi:hypothetical protein OGY83_18060 [Citrobacter sp. Cpo090]|uniref:F4 family fimbrial subunit n=1 Tax=Citrobacter sp. Cpo090 TaxID=2985139 RepID=UPI00257629AB|nr:hypothetical protein [Citrobacter sp. Cpo090]MDM2845525.1 hypothetical protein [Citrobacter sp. Cpo090]